MAKNSSGSSTGAGGGGSRPGLGLFRERARSEERLFARTRVLLRLKNRASGTGVDGRAFEIFGSRLVRR